MALTAKQRIINRQADHNGRIENTEDQIRSVVASISQNLDRIIDALDNDVRLNSLGELQSRGPDLDRLIAIREEQIDTGTMLNSLVVSEILITEGMFE